MGTGTRENFIHDYKNFKLIKIIMQCFFALIVYECYVEISQNNGYIENCKNEE